MVLLPIFALLAIVTPIAVLADVTPSEPGPGDVFAAGGPCHVAWDGDTKSLTAWKDMAIQLMSGSNLQMQHVTTVATGQDGTKTGSFQYTCPEVTPYAAIYFYQLSSPHTSVKTWTTRFNIISDKGDFTLPANDKQPSGEDIPWGVGQLVDTSKVVPPPFSGSNSTTSLNSTSSSSPILSSSSSRFIITSSTSSLSSSSSSSASIPSASGTITHNANTSAALPNVLDDKRVWLAVIGAVFVTLL